MTDRESLDLNWGRWLLLGLGAVVSLIVVLIFFANLAKSDDGSAPAVAQVEWSIELIDYTPTLGTVTLKGDTPLGTPTETWQNDFMLARTVGGVGFTWNMDVSPEVPMPVYEIDQASGCDDLNAQLLDWANQVASAPGEARRAEASSFAQHALSTMLADGCDPGLDD